MDQVFAGRTGTFGAAIMRRLSALRKSTFVDAAAGLTLAAALLLAWSARASWAIWATLLAIGLVGLVWGWRYGRGWHILGPLFFYDLARLARRGRTTVLRCAYALLLLVWLCVLVSDRFPGMSVAKFFEAPPAMAMTEWADFARSYGVVILSLQAGAVLVLTPAYLAGAIAEEKERRTLHSLFATDLRDREIVLGKLCGRLVHLATILLAALPIFALTRLWGGVDDDVLLAGFAVSSMSMLSIGSISILCSVFCRTVLGAVMSSYAFVFLINVTCLAIPATSPILFVANWDMRVAMEWKEWQEQWKSMQPYVGPGFGTAVAALGFPPPNPRWILAEMLIPYFAVHGLLFIVCTILAIRFLRDGALAPGETLLTGVPAGPTTTKSTTMVSLDPGLDRKWHAPAAVYRPRPVTEPALLWKEMIHGLAAAPGPDIHDWLRASRKQLVFGLAIVAGSSLLWTYYDPELWLPLVSALTGVLSVLTILLIGTWCLLVAFRAAGSITREKDQLTLTGLLTLPIDCLDILRAKWVGGILRYRQLGYGLAACWLLGLATGALHPFAVLLLAGLCAVHLACLGSIGLWLSVSRHTTLRANMNMAAFILLLFTGPWLGMTFGEPFFGATEGGWLHRLLEVRMAPGQTWWFSSFSWRAFAASASGDRAFFIPIIEATLSIPLFAAAAYFFWWRAARRFRTLCEGW